MKQRCYYCGVEHPGSLCPECGGPGPGWEHMRPSSLDYARLLWVVVQTAYRAARKDLRTPLPRHTSYGPGQARQRASHAGC